MEDAMMCGDCAFQDGSYPCGYRDGGKLPDCELCHKIHRAAIRELPKEIRKWLTTLLDLPDKEVKVQIATYLVEHHPELMESLERAKAHTRATYKGGLMDKAQEKIAEWITYARHSTMSNKWFANRILNELKQLGYRKPLDRPELREKIDMEVKNEWI